MRSAVNVLAVLAAGLLLCGCGSGRVAPATSSEKPETPITDRALAAGMLRHVDQEVVTGVSGRTDEYGVSASVDTTLDSVASIAVTVMPVGSPQAVRRCGQDSGYVVLECRTSPALLELARRGSGADPGMPVLSGRSYDEQRGGLLVQVWGEPDAPAEELVRSVMTDPLIGVKTSSELTAAGRSLSDYEEQEVSGEIGIRD